MRKGRLHNMGRNQWMKWCFTIIGAAMLLNSCFKEELNHLPELISYSVSPEFILPGDTVIIHTETMDADNDPLYYQWKSQFGTIISEEAISNVTWIVPQIDGVNYCEVAISDGKTLIHRQIPVQVHGAIYDTFTHQDSLWNVVDGEMIIQEGAADLISLDTVKNAIMYIDLLDQMEPPYAIHMDLSLEEPATLFTPSDKYGIYLNFFNAGADTMVKAMWFRIYPSGTIRNWKISVLADNGPSSGWINLDDTSYGISDQVQTIPGQVNRLKLVVLADHTLNLYIDNNLLFTKNTLINEYLSAGKMPRLILERFGVRTSAGKVQVDNVFISHDTGMNSSELF